MYKDCNVVFLEDINGIIKIKNKNGNLFITSDEEIKEVFKGYAIAVLKEDNRIKELIEVITVQEDGCNRYTSIDNQQFSFKYHSIYPIIATTDSSLKITKSVTGYTEDRCRTFYQDFPLPQLSQKFIQQYIKNHNEGNSITNVKVEYEDDWIKADYSLDVAYRPVINSDCTISIKPIKES